MDCTTTESGPTADWPTTHTALLHSLLSQPYVWPSHTTFCCH